jgi:hypothetical protein
MKSSRAPLQSASRPRAALAEQLAHIADLGSRMAATPPRSEAARAPEHAGLQQLLSSALAARNERIADVLAEEEMPRCIKTYQDLVLKVNAAWNDVLALDDAMRRRFPARPSVFNTAGPHARAVVAPSTDNSPVPALPIDPRKLFAAASAATDRFLENLASDAEAGFRRN